MCGRGVLVVGDLPVDRHEHLRLIVDAGRSARGPRHLCGIGPSDSAGVGSLCVEQGPIGAAVRIGDASCSAAFDAVARLTSDSVMPPTPA